IFFILSGFVLAYSYGKRSAMGLGPFMARRFIRLYPMFLAGLILGGLVLVMAASKGISTLSARAAVAGTVLNAFYIPFLNQDIYYHAPAHGLAGEIFPANPPSWSLFFEIAVNLFFFHLAGMGRKALVLLCAVFLAAIFAIALLLSVISGGGITMEGGWNTLGLMAGFPRVFYGFSLGILIFKFGRQSWLLSVTAKARQTSVAVVLVLAAIMLLLSLPTIPHLGSVYYLVAIALAAPALVLLGSALSCRNPVLSSIVRFLGWLSYPLYCVHYPVIRLFRLFAPLPGMAGVILPSLASIGLAAVLTLVYDQPVRQWLTRLFTKSAGIDGLPTPVLAE
ncbi:MAG TPA: acyltransferase, partial [Rhizomicrobium sp.]|nr:acyltransferase [Rhizomicrobium sp.]